MSVLFKIVWIKFQNLDFPPSTYKEAASVVAAIFSMLDPDYDSVALVFSAMTIGDLYAG